MAQQADRTICKLVEQLNRVEIHDPNDRAALARDLRDAADLLDPPERPADAAPREDGDLVKLGRRLAPLLAGIAAVEAAYNASWDAVESEAYLRMGWRPSGFRSDDELHTYLAHRAQLEEESGAQGLFNELERLRQAAEPLMGTILAWPALTVTDCAIKALAVAAAHPGIWTKVDDDLDWHETFTKDLIESVCSVAGVHMLHATRNLSKGRRALSHLN